MEFGAIIIGDEILSGKCQDRHFPKLVSLLRERGLTLTWCQYLGDELNEITKTLRHTFASSAVVFCFGGIGATPDDHTRQSVAKALDVSLYPHPDAVKEIEAQFSDAAYPKRILMAELPAGSTIIPNSYNRVPGFSIKQHHFLPGFPIMAWPMVEWVLEQYYSHLFHQNVLLEQSILVYELGESAMIDLMQEVVARFDQAKLFSLPSLGDAEERRYVELGMRGNPQQVKAAISRLKEGVVSLGGVWEEKI